MAAVAVVTAFLAALLRRTHPEHAMAISLTAGILLITAALAQLAPLFGDLQAMLEKSGLGNEYIRILFKALGVCVITQLASDACRDAGEQGLASKTEFAGKLVLLTLSLPLFQKIGDIALSLIGEAG